MGGIRGKGGKLRRLATGLTVGAAAEGSTEAAQEALLLLSNPEVDLTSEEGIHRLINSFAAGAGFGGPIGGIANLAGGKKQKLVIEGETDLLKTEPEPVDPSVTAEEELNESVVAPIQDIDSKIIELQGEIQKAESLGENARVERLGYELAKLELDRAKLEKGAFKTDEQLAAQIAAQVAAQIAGPVTVPTKSEVDAQAKAQAEEAGPVTVPTEAELDAQAEAQADLEAAQAEAQAAQVETLNNARLKAQAEIEASGARIDEALADPTIEKQARAVKRELGALGNLDVDAENQAAEDAAQAEFDEAMEAYDAQQAAQAEQGELDQAELPEITDAERVESIYNAVIKRLFRGGEDLPTFEELTADAKVGFAEIAEEAKVLLDEGGKKLELRALVRRATYDIDQATKARKLKLQDKKLKKPKLKKPKLKKEAKEVTNLKNKLKSLEKNLEKSKKDNKKAIGKAVKKAADADAKAEKPVVNRLKALKKKADAKAKKAEKEKRDLENRIKQAGKLGMGTVGGIPTNEEIKAFRKLQAQHRKGEALADAIEKKDAKKSAEALAKKPVVDTVIKDDGTLEHEELGPIPTKQGKLDLTKKGAAKREAAPVVKPKSNSEGGKRWVSFAPQWAKALGIKFADLPAIVQGQLTMPQRGQTALPQQKEVLEELRNNKFWAVLEDLMAGVEADVDEVVDAFYNSNTKDTALVNRVLKAVLSGTVSADVAINARVVEELKGAIVRRLEGAATKHNKISLRDKNTGVTTNGKLIAGLGLYDSVIADGYTLTQYNP